MRSRGGFIAMTVCILTAVALTTSKSEHYYFNPTQAYELARSNEYITVKCGALLDAAQIDDLIRRHNEIVQDSAIHLSSVFYQLHLIPSVSFNVASATLMADTLVHSILPVYTSTVVPELFAITNRVDIQFSEFLSPDSALMILNNVGLSLVDSSRFRHNLWYCILNGDTTENSLEVGNRLHARPEVYWAAARRANPPFSLNGLPSDSYFVHQYYLKSTGQNGGTPNVDIDADTA